MNEILEEAQAAIEADKQRRAEQCLAEITKALQTYRCDIVGQPQIADGRIVASVLVIAKP